MAIGVCWTDIVGLKLTYFPTESVERAQTGLALSRDRQLLILPHPRQNFRGVIRIAAAIP
jgi:hypothetical protein